VITDINYLSLADAAGFIRAGKLSPVELTRFCLDRIESLNPRIHAFITVLSDLAIEAATRAEKEIYEGRYRGPLHGIPIAHKDILWTKGIRTTAHSRLLETWIPHESATVVELFENAGAICLGKTALHEFAYGSPGPDEVFPGARNPWNLDYAPGSSSSGSGAAVAAGLCMAATGTDTGGSVRHPACVCGVVGMKATYGLVSTYGVIPLAPSLDHVGPLTRTVMDNALVLQTMAGYDPRDPTSVAFGVPNFDRLIGKEIKRMRVGVPRRFIEAYPHSSEVIDAFDRSLVVLRELGALVEEIDPPGLIDCIDAVNTIIGFEAYRYHRDSLQHHSDLLGQAFKGRFDRRYNEDDYERALAIREQLKMVYRDLFSSGIDVVVSPGKEVPADLMTDLLAAPSKRPVSNRIYSLTGMPALTMPMALSAQGLPMGIQIAANAFREDIIYQVASAFEATTGFSQLRPSLA
jgi:aspartyl-tRNA(Asn)/glutamyl-tRNA(Gln) amidotransferase subunit A